MKPRVQIVPVVIVMTIAVGVAFGLLTAFKNGVHLPFSKGAEDEAATRLPPPKAPPAEKRPAPNINPATPTSFADVTSRLDPGGSMFGYLSTSQWLQQMSDQLQVVESFVRSLSETPDGELSVTTFFDGADRLLKRSGMQEVTGVGYSAFALAGGLHRSKTFLHRAPDAVGYVWSFIPAGVNELPGLKLLPPQTVYAAYAKLDLFKIWSIIASEIETSGGDEAKTALGELMTEVHKTFGVDLDQFLEGITDGAGFIVTSDPNHKVSLKRIDGTEPAPGKIREGGLAPTYSLSRFDFALIVGTLDSTLYNTIVTRHELNNDYHVKDEGSLRMLVMEPVAESLSGWHWTLGFDGEHLMFGTGEHILKQVAAAKSGAGLKDDEKFAALAGVASTKGNVFTYTGAGFERLRDDLCTHLNAIGESEGATMIKASLGVFHAGGSSFGVLRGLKDGWLWTKAGTAEPATELLKLGIIKPFRMIAEIVVPNFKRGRAAAQTKSCIRNQEAIDAAKRKWAEAGGFGPSTVPTTRNITRLMGSIPACPTGGRYTIGAVSAVCKCSQKEHAR